MSKLDFDLSDLRLLKKIDAIHIVIIMILIYTIGLSYYTIMKHYAFQTLAYDLGIFLNSFWNTIYQGKFFYTTLWEGSRFQNHFSPILFLILPLYEIFPSHLPEILLILQATILALGALPIYWIARNEMNKKAGVIFALMYLTYPALLGTNRFDFHEVVLAPTMILFAFHYFREKKYSTSSLFIILSLISREDVAMVIVPMAMLWLWERKNNWSIRDKETFFCISTIFVGLFWFVAITKIIIPIFSSEGYWFVKEYKPEYLLLDPYKKFIFLVDLFLPLFFIPLFNRWILVASPIYARILFSNRNTRYSIKNQHTSLLIPFMFISSIYVVKYISEKLDENTKNLSKRLLYPLLAGYLMISFFICPLKDDILKHNTIQQDVVVLDGGPTPTPTLLSVTPHYNALAQVIDMIPTNASVYTQNNIFPHMADRPKVYYVIGDDQIFRGWNNEQIAQIVPWKEGNFEYILTDNTNKDWSVLRNLDIESVELLKQNYGLYVAIDQIYLFKRGYNGTINTPVALFNNFDNGYINGYYNGVLISYYNDNNLSGSSSILTDRVSNINFKWKKSSPIPGVVNNRNFSLKFDGYIYIPQNDYYSFQLMSDGGSMLYLDGQLAIDDWLRNHPVEDAYQAYLKKGLHEVHVDYKERKDTTYINLNWSTPWKGSFEPIPEEYFYIPKNLDDYKKFINVNNNTINNTNRINNNDNTTNLPNSANNMTKIMNDIKNSRV